MKTSSNFQGKRNYDKIIFFYLQKDKEKSRDKKKYEKKNI